MYNPILDFFFEILFQLFPMISTFHFNYKDFFFFTCILNLSQHGSLATPGN